MRLTSALPFPLLTFKHWAGDDGEAAVLIVKGVFGINADGDRLLHPLWRGPDVACYAAGAA